MIGQKAEITFRRPQVTLDPSVICDVAFDGPDTVVHAALEKYFEKRRKSIDEPIKNKLVIHLPFEADPEPSSDLLGSGFQNLIISPPPSEFHASRSIIVTFKKKSSNFASSRVVEEKIVPIFASNEGIPCSAFSCGTTKAIKKKNKRAATT